MSLARFNEKWGSTDYPPEAVLEAELHSAEERLGIRFPSDYREAVLATGLPQPTIALLDAIVDRRLDLNDLSDLYSPTQIVEETLGWRELGMPEQFIVIASDCCGN